MDRRRRHRVVKRDIGVSGNGHVFPPVDNGPVDRGRKYLKIKATLWHLECNI